MGVNVSPGERVQTANGRIAPIESIERNKDRHDDH